MRWNRDGHRQTPSVFHFYQVCEYRSYSKAAEVLGYSSHHIVSGNMQQLAKQLGTETLFTRHSRGVTPTPAAIILYKQIKPAFHVIDNAEVEFCKTHNLPTENLPRPTKLCPSCVEILTTLVKN